MDAVANILDPIHAVLPEDVWDDPASDEPKLKEHHKRWIHVTVVSALKDAGYTHTEQWLSLVLTGSLTTYQYAEHSDVDVSLFVDADVFPEWGRAEMIGVMVEHVDGTTLPGTHFPMQCFVVPPGVTKEQLYQPGLRSGYDLATDTWLSPPDRSRSHDVQREQATDYAYALECADKMERLLKYEPEKAIMYWHQLHHKRQRDQRAGKGDYALSNIIYKFLANRGLFDQISEVSGEYIAKTAWMLPGDRKYVRQQEERQQRIRDRFWDERTQLWNHAYDQGAAPGDMNMHYPSDTFVVGPAEDARLPRLDRQLDQSAGQGWEPQWHTDYQEQMRKKFETNPDATSHDYEDWLNWYAQHAPQHFNPPVDQQAVIPQEPKAWFAKTAGPPAQEFQDPYPIVRTDHGYIVMHGGKPVAPPFTTWMHAWEWVEQNTETPHIAKTAGIDPRHRIDPRALDMAARHVGLRNPVNVQPVSQVFKQNGRLHAGMYHGLKNGVHQMSVCNWLGPDKANELVWHELRHAEQRERDPEAFARGMEDYHTRQGLDAYLDHPFEAEARQQQAHFPVALPALKTAARALMQKFRPESIHPRGPEGDELPFIFAPEHDKVFLGPANSYHNELIAHTPELRDAYELDGNAPFRSAPTGHVHGRLTWPDRKVHYLGQKPELDASRTIHDALGAPLHDPDEPSQEEEGAWF